MEIKWPTKKEDKNDIDNQKNETNTGKHKIEFDRGSGDLAFPLPLKM